MLSGFLFFDAYADRLFVSLCGCGGFWVAHYTAVCDLGCFFFLQAFSESA